MRKIILLLLFIPFVSFGQNDFIGSVERISNEIDNFISKDSKIEIIAKGFSWSEGPVWSKKLNAVLFSDVPNNVIYKWDEINGLDVFLNEIGYSGIVTNSKKDGTNGLTIDQQGNLIICMHGDRRIVKLEDWQSNKVIPLATSFNKKLFNSPNDLVYNSKNELFFTDPPYGFKNGDNDELKELQFNGVFRLSPNGELKLLIKNLLRPNGIAISNDETGISEDPDVRFEVAKKIVERAADHGISSADIVVDPLVMPIGAINTAGRQVMHLLRRLREELKVNTTCGASNVSFGIPARNNITGTFLAMAIGPPNDFSTGTAPRKIIPKPAILSRMVLTPNA